MIPFLAGCCVGFIIGGAAAIHAVYRALVKRGAFGPDGKLLWQKPRTPDGGPY